MPVRSERRALVIGEGPFAAAIETLLCAGRLSAIRSDWAHACQARHWRGLGAPDLVVLLVQPTDMDAILRLPLETRTARTVAATTMAVEAALNGGPRLIVVSSAMVCGTRPDGTFIQDTDPATVDEGGLLADLVAAERCLDPVREHAPDRLAIIRPAAIVGPGVDTVVTRHFEAPALLGLRGAPMSWQFLHLRDLASAIRTVATENLSGVFTAGCEGTLATAEALVLSGKRSITWPRRAAFAAVERLHRLKVLPAPLSDLTYVVEPWPVTSAALLAAGWRPHYTNAQCLSEVMTTVAGRHTVAGRRLGGRDAAVVGAGAAVAALSTAALMRRNRR